MIVLSTQAIVFLAAGNRLPDPASIKHIGLPSLLMFATDTVARILVLARFGFYKLCSICTPPDAVFVKLTAMFVKTF